MLIRLGGRNAILTLTLTRLAVVGIEKADQGRTIAEFERRTDFGCNTATPAVADGKVVLTSNYNQNNTTLLEFSNGRPGTIWTSSHCALVSSPVIHKDCVFIIDQSLKCLDLATGRLKWRGGSFGHGSCIVTAGDDKIIAFGQGRLVLLEARAGNNEYRELSRLAAVVPGTCYPHVAFADGLICCKDKDGQLVVLSVRAGRVSATR
jgi:outer membrane protein assembly factor BamB